MKRLTENKYGILYFLSFLIYPIMVFFEWIDHIDEGGIWCVLTVLILFELSYIMFLRKKEGVSLGRSISRGFLYGLFMLNLLTVLFLIEDFFFGYTENGLFWVGDTYYGLEAWKQDKVGILLFWATLAVFLVYAAGYFIISAVIRNISQGKK